jgi:hypothetical protein
MVFELLVSCTKVQETKDSFMHGKLNNLIIPSIDFMKNFKMESLPSIDFIIPNK